MPHSALGGAARPVKDRRRILSNVCPASSRVSPAALSLPFLDNTIVLSSRVPVRHLQLPALPPPAVENAAPAPSSTTAAFLAFLLHRSPSPNLPSPSPFHALPTAGRAPPVAHHSTAASLDAAGCLLDRCVAHPEKPRPDGAVAGGSTGHREGRSGICGTACQHVRLHCICPPQYRAHPARQLGRQRRAPRRPPRRRQRLCVGHRVGLAGQHQGGPARPQGAAVRARRCPHHRAGRHRLAAAGGAQRVARARRTPRQAPRLDLARRRGPPGAAPHPVPGACAQPGHGTAAGCGARAAAAVL